MHVSYDLWEMCEGTHLYSLAAIYAAFETMEKIYDKIYDDYEENRIKQEKIRKEYPFYDEGIEEQNELLINTNGKSAQVKSSQNKNYSFVSVDKTYKVNLTSTFIAISTRKYTQWEEFSEKVRQVVKAFQETYEVPFYTRVGLRYIDVIQRSVLGLSNEKWSDLVKPHVLERCNTV